ncbi:CHAT domain-containing protein [Microcystis aeruginosa]|nr:CHAT domain-containing protein [Microcystis aeruginosa]
MPQEVEFNIVTQDTQSFLLEIRISNDSNSSRIRKRLSVQFYPDKLKRSFEQWQQAFNHIVNRNYHSRNTRRTGDDENNQNIVENEDDDDAFYLDYSYRTNYNNCLESYQSLITELNNWLNSGEDWQKVRDWLTLYLDKSEAEIQVTIQTDDPILKQLPWQAWDLFSQNYPQAEIAIGPPEYEPPEKWEKIRQNPQVRILVILGSNENITLDEDSKLLNRVREHGATLLPLEQPTLDELKNVLAEPKGWNIIFYAGHSETNDEGKGVLHLNERESITIDDIKEPLEVAIKNGLYLAIFNSCDGLGIAAQLAELRLPQSIVMKEEIDNQMAIDFLQYFLDSFSSNKPLFVSVGNARKHLEKTYNNSDQFPGGHWLPVIVPNPAVPLATWKGFLSESDLSLKWRIPLIIGGIIGVLGLPLSILYEFGWDKAIFYAKLYPHIILYPPFMFWAALWLVYKGFTQIINRADRGLRLSLFVVLAISIVPLMIEMSGSNMLLLELNKTAQASIDLSTLNKNMIADIQKIPKDILDTQNIFQKDHLVISKAVLEKSLSNYIALKKDDQIPEERAKGFHKLMEIGLDYPATWKGQKNWVSLSRWFYAYTFLAIIFTVLIFFVLWVQNKDPRKFYNQIRYFEYLVFAQIMVVFWIPFRLYYIIKTKNILFGYTNLQWVKTLDPFLYLVIPILFFFILYQTIRQKHKYWMLIITSVTICVSLWIGYGLTDVLDRTFFLNTSNIGTWTLFPILIGLAISLFLNYQDE